MGLSAEQMANAFVLAGFMQKYRVGLLSWIRHAEERISSVSEAITRNMRGMGFYGSKIHLVNTKIMPAQTYRDQVKELSVAVCVRATSIIESARMRKSANEQEPTRKSAGLARFVLQHTG